jgi:hypothetical protein
VSTTGSPKVALEGGGGVSASAGGCELTDDLLVRAAMLAYVECAERGQCVDYGGTYVNPFSCELVIACQSCDEEPPTRRTLGTDLLAWWEDATAGTGSGSADTQGSEWDAEHSGSPNAG